MTRSILTCSQYFTDLALNELQRHHPHVQVICQLSPQHLFLENPGSFDQLTRPWRSKPPIYLHHAFPVHAEASLTGSIEDLCILKEAISTLDVHDAAVQVIVMADFPLSYDVEMLTRSLSKDQGKQQRCGRIISILITGDGMQVCAYIGVSWATQNLSPYAGGIVPAMETVPNRAGLKMLEAIHCFDLKFRANNHVLDLGAAPGAWTTVFRRRGLRVTAVSPGEMYYRWLLDDPGVRICQITAEAYLKQCDTCYDLIVNDMYLDARDSARLMVDYVDFLRPEGIAIMTLKLAQRNRRRIMDHALRILRKGYKIIRVRQLVSNRKEVTLFLRRK